jgi:FkbM family methyltransferase
MPLVTYWRNMLLLKAMRRLIPFGNYALPIRIRGHWYWFCDESKSDTREIVLHELEGPGQFYKLPEKIPDKAVILDCGAHVGMFSLPLARENPNALFICIEPDKANYRNLIKNMKRLKLTNVMPLNLGIWDNPNELLFSMHETKNSGGSRTFDTKHWMGDTSLVHSITIQSLIESLQIKSIWLLKMDTEGAEFKAIKNPSDLQNVERFIGEIHIGKASKAEESITQELINQLPKYRYVRLDGDKHEIYSNW